ncbi:Hypothetical protein GLP15_1962 [Giardia lamblia P15]|uniref:Uncharacterized protein n=1 Tax=Giardia intestinalis (strain P15) TaxID=658858 RepID=E1F662_GIAIA|nr:Hypothetical protein GLP15_1962 [Giardia lamblia P15]
MPLSKRPEARRVRRALHALLTDLYGYEAASFPRHAYPHRSRRDVQPVCQLATRSSRPSERAGGWACVPAAPPGHSLCNARVCGRIRPMRNATGKGSRGTAGRSVRASKRLAVARRAARSAGGVVATSTFNALKLICTAASSGSLACLRHRGRPVDQLRRRRNRVAAHPLPPAAGSTSASRPAPPAADHCGPILRHGRELLWAGPSWERGPAPRRLALPLVCAELRNHKGAALCP